MANSLSWNRRIVLPAAIDPANTVLRVDLRNLNWNDKLWERIVEANPYGTIYQSAIAKACYKAAATEMPMVRADWFVFAASRPPLYHEMLQIPETDAELERLLQVSAADDIEQEKVARAGFGRSGVSQNNRLIERHESPYGAYWKSYDFGGNTARQNLFDHPLGPGDDEEYFAHDGGEIIFTLPNGLQGYMLTDGAGNRIDKGPTEIVSDPNQPDRAVLNGISCMSCHFAGMIAKADEVRAHVEANRAAFPDAAEIEALYPPAVEFAALIAQDAERFAAALQKLGQTKITRTGEPVSTMAERFQAEIDLKLAAAELGLPPDKFVPALRKSTDLTRVLGPLNVPGGTVKRDTFVQVYQEAAQAFGRGKSRAGAVSSALAASETPASRRPSACPDNRHALSCSQDKTVRLWELDSGNEVHVFEGFKHEVVALWVSRDGRSALATDGQSARQFDLKGKQETLVLTLSQFGRALAAAFSPDGRMLLLANGYDMQIVETEGGTPLGTIEGQRGHMLWNLAFSPDGKLIAAAANDAVVVYDFESKRRLARFEGHSGNLKGLAFGHDNRHVASTSTDGTLRIWRIAKDKS